MPSSVGSPWQAQQPKRAAGKKGYRTAKSASASYTTKEDSCPYSHPNSAPERPHHPRRACVTSQLQTVSPPPHSSSQPCKRPSTPPQPASPETPTSTGDGWSITPLPSSLDTSTLVKDHSSASSVPTTPALSLSSVVSTRRSDRHSLDKIVRDLSMDTTLETVPELELSTMDPCVAIPILEVRLELLSLVHATPPASGVVFSPHPAAAEVSSEAGPSTSSHIRATRMKKPFPTHWSACKSQGI